MVRRRKYIPRNRSKFDTTPEFLINGKQVVKGDIIKIANAHGRKFKVIGLTTNNNTGKSWVDCYELVKGVPAATCSFYPERVKPIKKRKRHARA